MRKSFSTPPLIPHLCTPTHISIFSITNNASILPFLEKDKNSKLLTVRTHEQTKIAHAELIPSIWAGDLGDFWRSPVIFAISGNLKQISVSLMPYLSISGNWDDLHPFDAISYDIDDLRSSLAASARTLWPRSPRRKSTGQRQRRVSKVWTSSSTDMNSAT